MVNNELLTFVKDQVAQGKTRPEIQDMLVTKGGWDDKDVDEAFETMQMSGMSMPHVLQKMDDAEKGKDAAASSPSVHSYESPVQEQKPAEQPQVAFNSFLSGRSAPKVMEPNADLPVETDTHMHVSAPAPVAAPNPVPASFGVDLTPEPKPVPPLSFTAQRVAPAYTPAPKPIAVEMLSEFHQNIPPSVAEPALRPAINPVVSPALSSAPAWQMRQEIKPEPLPSVPPPAPAENIIRPAFAPEGQPKTEAPMFKPDLDLDSASKPVRVASILPPKQSPPRVLDPSNQPRAKILPFMSPSDRPDSVIMPKPKPRVLFGIIMLFIGLVIGSVLMHAYLSGYFDALLGR